MKITGELKAGIIALVAIAAFIWGYSFIKGEKLFDSSKQFYAVYDNVEGLTPSAQVTINGYEIGKVDAIDPHPKKLGKFIVSFSLDKEYTFSKNSTAQLYAPSLIGGKVINIVPVYDNDLASAGDTLASNIDVGLMGGLGDKIAPLQGQMSSFLTETDVLLKGFNQVLDTDGKNNLKQSLASLNSMLASFNTASKSLNKMLAKNGKLDSVLTNASTASLNLANLSDSLNNANLKSSALKLEKTLNNFNTILSKIEKGEGSVGKLLKDEGLYKNLEGAAKEMEELLRELKVNPKRFVHFSLFGKKPKPYKEEAEKSEK